MNTTHTTDKTQTVWPESNIPHRVAQRAISRFVVNANGCHISTYSVASHGYAQIGWNSSGKKYVTTAHRAAWVAHTGEQIRVNMTIDHTCKERRCVNPDHLRVLSIFENGRRTYGRDWKIGYCANGHPNKHLVIASGGRRKDGRKRQRMLCQKCKHLYGQRAYWRRKHGSEPFPDDLLLATERERE